MSLLPAMSLSPGPAQTLDVSMDYEYGSPLRLATLWPLACSFSIEGARLYASGGVSSI